MILKRSRLIRSSLFRYDMQEEINELGLVSLTQESGGRYTHSGPSLVEDLGKGKAMKFFGDPTDP